MVKKICFLVLTLVVTLSLVGCGGKYEEEAGVYKLYSMEGDLNMSMFKYYDIELTEGGKCIVKAAYTTTTQLYESSGTFSIEGDEISIVTKSGGSKITEVYDYIDGVIIMEAEANGVSFTAKFKRD